MGDVRACMCVGGCACDTLLAEQYILYIALITNHELYVAGIEYQDTSGPTARGLELFLACFLVLSGNKIFIWVIYLYHKTGAINGPHC